MEKSSGKRRSISSQQSTQKKKNNGNGNIFEIKIHDHDLDSRGNTLSSTCKNSTAAKTFNLSYGAKSTKNDQNKLMNNNFLTPNGSHMGQKSMNFSNQSGNRKRGNSIQLYKNLSLTTEKQSQIDINTIKTMRYPAPQPFSVDIQKNISNILQKQDQQQTSNSSTKNPLFNHPRTLFKPQKNELKKTFLKPKAIESSRQIKKERPRSASIGVGQSKIKSRYLQNYKKMMEVNKPENVRVSEQHPLMVEDLLFSQISASAWASHKWYSKQAESNVKHLNNHPNIGQYPHTKFTVQELNYIDELKKRQRERKLKIVKNQKSFVKQENLMMDTSRNLDQYLQNIIKNKLHDQKIYSQEVEEYRYMSEFAKSYQKDNHSYELDRAESDVQFIIEQKKTMDYNRDLKIRQKLVERRENLITNDTKIDTETDYCPMPFFKYECWKRHQSAPKKVKLKVPKKKKKTDQYQVDGGFEEQDIFLARPAIVPPSKVEFIAKQEESM